MVKAYLKYNQERVLSCLVGTKANLKVCKIKEKRFVISAANEVVNFTNLHTGEVENRIYDREAAHGDVTCIQTSQNLLAIGYQDGAVLVFDLTEQAQEQTVMTVSDFEQLHSFEFHRSPITALVFADENTQLISGAQDTYIILYDLVNSTAEYKLMGHTEPVTQLQTLVTRHPETKQLQRHLLSGAKDGLLKLWDLQIQKCVGTYGEASLSKVQDFVMIAELSLLAVGGSDSQIKLFYLNNDAKGLTLELKSSLKKESGHRVQQLYFDRKRQTLLVLSADNKVEAWSVNTDNTEAVLKKLTRQTKKSLKRTYSEAQEGSVEVDKSELLRKIEARDYDMALHFAKNASVHTLDTVHKAKCFQVLPSREFEIIVAYHNNRLYHYSITEEASKQLGVIGELHTHETPIRGVTLSPDDSLFATFSFDCLKVWSVDLYASNKSGLLQINCRQNFPDLPNILTAQILPGNRYIVLGTKQGDLCLYDMNTNQATQRLKAHKKEIWEVAFHTNPAGLKGSLLIASASADKTIKFHTLAQQQNGQVQLQFYEKIETTDEVMGIKFSPNGQFFTFSLLDQTLKVCYVDTMKLLLNLYGHKLPVLSFDISSDGTLLATGSADKNLKIWGMQFGDIHKSMFIHQDSITCVRFIQGTHYVLTASKDREVKMIDCDTYDEVFVFDSFMAEVWAVQPSSIGDFFVTVSADRAIRVWKQTSEQAFVTDEQNERQEKQMLKEAGKEFAEIDLQQASMQDPFAKDKVMKIESKEVIKRTAETIRYGDDLMFALEMSEQWREEVEQYQLSCELFEKGAGPKPEKPKPSIHFLGRTVFDHVLLRLKQVRNSDLESALKFLNYGHACSLLFYCEHYLRNNIEIELATRCVLSIVKSYQSQLQQQAEMLGILRSLHLHMKFYFSETRDVIGQNLCAIEIQGKQVAEAQNSDFMAFDQPREGDFF